MHFFAVFLFFSFGVMVLTMLGRLTRVFGEPVYRFLRDGRALLAGVWGVGLAWLANLNMWLAWGISGLRYDWVGVTLTGLALGGTAVLLLTVSGLFSGLYRKLDDEAEQIEKRDLTPGGSARNRVA